MRKEQARFPALDALRGIAALTVVLTHIVTAVRGSPHWSWIHDLDKSAVSPMMYGVSPVMLFFVLSGFVLALSLDRSSIRDTPAFLTKRVTRIWLPYVVWLALFAVAAEATMSLSAAPFPIDHTFRASFELGGFLEQVLLIGPTYEVRYLGVSWTLVHELRVSLIFPLLMWALWRREWYVMVFASLAACVLGKILMEQEGLNLYTLDWRNSVYIAGMFIQGMTLAKYRGWIAKTIAEMSRPARWVLIFIAVSFYAGGVWDVSIRGLPWFPLGIMVGCALLVVLGITTAGTNPIVNSRPAQWLGKVSYSVYLVHPLVLMVCFRLLAPDTPPYLVAVLVIVATLALSDLSYRLVEHPSMMLGRRLTKGSRKPAYFVSES